jgi:hypothetical protein
MSLVTRRLATDWYDTAEAQDRAKSWFRDNDLHLDDRQGDPSCAISIA